MTDIESATCPYCGETFTDDHALRFAKSCADSCRARIEATERGTALLWHVSGDKRWRIRERMRRGY